MTHTSGIVANYLLAKQMPRVRFPAGVIKEEKEEEKKEKDGGKKEKRPKEALNFLAGDEGISNLQHERMGRHL